VRAVAARGSVRAWLGVGVALAMLALTGHVVVAGAGARAAVLPDPFPGVAAAYLVRAGDADLWGADVDRPLPPASLAKLMTALIIAEHMAGDPVVVVSKRAAAAEGSRLGLRAGERVRVSMLLAAMLIRSANDACRALAEWHAGSERAFVARMNDKARVLGLSGTHYTDACGFDSPAQRSTARDLARLGLRVQDDALLARVVATVRFEVRTEGGRRIAIENTNALLGRLPEVIGTKTGYTKGAGRCLVAVAEREGARVVVVLLGAGDRWWDAVAMIEAAFDRLERTRDGRRR
jgi:D-alanyl-D-alanine carboxypeptidase (penicillin-binding protein 5/6)